MRKNVLLLDGDGTQTLPIVKSLYNNGYIIHAFYDDKYSYGYASRYVHKKVIISSIKEEFRYLIFMKQYVVAHTIDVLFPLSDKSAAFISKYKLELIQIVKYIMPDYDVFMKGYDKNQLMSVCEKYNFPHPRTITLNKDSIKNIDGSVFPALIKPNITCGARGLTLVNNINEFNKLYPQIKKQYGDCHLQEFIHPGGAQVEVQLLLGDNYELLFSSVIYKYRWYPENAGSSCCNISVINEEIVITCHELMKAIKWKGFADFDTIEDPKDGKLKIMELNPRVPACVKTPIQSGIDWGNIIVDEYLGNKHKKYNYVVGKMLRHIGFEILWFVYSPNRFKTRPSWFKFFGKDIYFQDFSWADPLPFFIGTLGNIKKQLSTEFRKAKSGLRR